MFSWSSDLLSKSLNPVNRRRDFLRLAAAFLANYFLPRRAFGLKEKESNILERRVIIVTFGGGVRYEDTFAPEGWINIPHLSSDLFSRGLFYPAARNEGITGHFNSTAALITGAWQKVDSYGSEPPSTPTVFEYFRKERRLPPEETWVIATNKSFSLIGGSSLRDYGDPYSANVILPKQLLIEAIKSAVSSEKGPGVEDRRALVDQMLSALDEGYEGYGWQVYESGRKLGHGLKQSLAKSLLDYIDDPRVPSSGDELTFFMAKEIMTRFSPSLLLINFWDIDIAHYGAYSLYLEAIRRTDRLVYELWQHAQSLAPYRDRTTLLVIPEMGRDGDVRGNGFANHRSGDESCRRLWLLALGAGVPGGTASERPIRSIDISPTVAEILGFKIPACEGKPLVELAV
jgi:hypothetical protein